MSSLFDTVAAGNVELVKQALTGASADPDAMKELNTTNSGGETALQLSIKNQAHNIAEVLIKAGANVNQACKESGTTKGYTALHFACRNGDIDGANLLLKHKAEINRQSDDGWTPLHCAAFSGHKNMLNVLLNKHKADPNILNEHRVGPIFFAASKGSVTMTRDLLRAGAKVDGVDAQGDSILHHCFAYQMQKLFDGGYDMPEAQLDVGVVLTIWGAPVDKTNLDGKTAFEYLNDDMPAYNDVLKIISVNASKFKASPTEWNYMTYLSAKVEHFIGLGLELKHAVDLTEKSALMEKERQDTKKEKEAERPAGGCPVMKSGGRKKKRGPDGKRITAEDSEKPAGPHGENMEIPADGSDPSGGQCPFFQKKKEEDNGADTQPQEEAAASKKAVVDTPHGEMEVPADGSDPSGGQCPFFAGKKSSSSSASEEKSVKKTEETQQQNNKTTATAGNPWVGAKQQQSEERAAAAPVEKTTPKAPSTLFDFLYENRTTIMMLIIAFFCGIWFEQIMGSFRGSGGIIGGGRYGSTGGSAAWHTTTSGAPKVTPNGGGADVRF